MKLSKKEREFVLKGRRLLAIAKNSSQITGYRKRSIPSKGEKKVIDFLVSEGIEFKREWFFNGCYSPKSKHLLYFDFFIPLYNLCIEYDGEQHYSKDKTESAMLNDFSKTAFCAKNRINLLRIKYTDFDKIETIICRRVDKITNQVHV